jgi:hypothetical protein
MNVASVKADKSSGGGAVDWTLLIELVIGPNEPFRRGLNHRRNH